MKFVILAVLFSSTLELYSFADDLINEVEKDVEYYLYTTTNPSAAIRFDENKINEIIENIPVKIIIHGRAGNNKQKIIKDMTSEYLKKGNCNVIQVNWGKIALEHYFVIVQKIQLLGTIVGRFLAKLYETKKILPSNIHLIGYSIGAHLSGYAGIEFYNITGFKISRITALDPAAPLYETESHVTKELLKQSPSEHGPIRIYKGLEPSDADVVDVIHSYGCAIGFIGRVGMADFYPNGGGFQPNCPLSCDSDPSYSAQDVENCYSCNHFVGPIHFTESINNQKFVGTKCNSWKDFNSGKCNNNLKILMGDGYIYSPEATGKFFLKIDTNQSGGFMTPEVLNQYSTTT